MSGITAAVPVMYCLQSSAFNENYANMHLANIFCYYVYSSFHYLCFTGNILFCFLCNFRLFYIEISISIFFNIASFWDLGTVSYIISECRDFRVRLILTLGCPKSILCLESKNSFCILLLWYFPLKVKESNLPKVFFMLRLVWLKEACLPKISLLERFSGTSLGSATTKYSGAAYMMILIKIIITES